MQVFRGPIARSLLLGAIALVLVLVLIVIVSGWSTRASQRAIDQISAQLQLALLTARLRSESLTLTELLHLDLIQTTQTEILRPSIQARQDELGRLLRQIQARTDPSDAKEVQLVNNTIQAMEAFQKQTELALTTHNEESGFGPETQAAINRLLAEHRGPLLSALTELEAYESERAEVTRVELDRITTITQNTVLITALGVMLSIAIMLVQVARRLIQPLELLRQGIERIRNGWLVQPIPIKTQDEMGDLAGALNNLSEELYQSHLKLEEYARTLESQVNERTFEAEQRALQAHTAAQITQAASGTLDLEELLRLSVNLIQERFDLYYVGLFLLDDTHQDARLRAGTGEAGQAMIEQGHHLHLDHNSMIGRCMLERIPEVELEITPTTQRFHNPLLPKTKSEMTLPLITQGEVIGAITVQSTSAKAFKESDITILQTMAGQLANVIGNARLYQEVQHEKELAEAASRAKSIFLANMSHEIRTPLNSILGFTALLQTEPNLTPTQRENILIVHRSSEALLSLINNILDLSKIEAGRMTLTEHTLNLPHLLDSLEALFRLRAMDKGLELRIKMSPELPRFVYTDEAKLRQVLINLLGNALKFTQHGGVLMQVRLATPVELSAHALQPVRKRAWLHFSVQDTGTGIAPEDLKRIFEPFFQAANSHATYPGTGLGLTISQQYVHLMGGILEVHSVPGEGSSFAFLIPVSLTTSPAESMTTLPEEAMRIEQAPEQPATIVPDIEWEALPDEQIDALRKAALRGDVDEILSIIQQIQIVQSQLAEILMGFANRFDLRGLMALLPAGSSKEGGEE